MTEKLMQGDCLTLLERVEDHSIDMILADLPYGMTDNKWDSVIPLQPLFKQYERVIKDHGAVLLFGMGKFGASLIMNASNKMPYRYEWVWQKSRPGGFLSSRHMPLRSHENIYVFYKHLPTYNPQMRQGFEPYENHYYMKRQKFAQPKGLHESMKPVELLERYIKVSTNESDTVLDCFMGSGSTGVAAKQLKRNFIGMELDPKYFEIAKKRIDSAPITLF